ncbi:retrovirus-related pol polyprotein from transposon TNT 1-94 [Tanacetum coccineum]
MQLIMPDDLEPIDHLINDELNSAKMLHGESIQEWPQKWHSLMIPKRPLVIGLPVAEAKFLTGDRSQLTNFHHMDLYEVTLRAQVLKVSSYVVQCALGQKYKETQQTQIEDTNQEKTLFVCNGSVWANALSSSVNGTKYILTLHEYYEKVGSSHETSVARSPQQNGVLERRNQTLIEAARAIVDTRCTITQELVPPPDKALVITLKWIYKVKLDELGDVLSMEVKTAFLMVNLWEELWLANRTNFDPDKPNTCTSLKKALYGLKLSNHACDIATCMRARVIRLWPIEKCLNAVKRIFRYLKGTVHRGLWYPKDSSIALTAFADADHAGCQDTRRSTSGSIQLLGDRLCELVRQKGKKRCDIQYGKQKYIAFVQFVVLQSFG